MLGFSKVPVFCVTCTYITTLCGLGSSVGVATGYRLDGPGIESRWDEIFRTCPDRPWGPPSLLYNGYRVFPGVKSGRGVTLTPHPLLVPWSRKSRAIPLLPLWAVRPVQKLSACTRVHFTFTFTKLYVLCLRCRMLTLLVHAVTSRLQMLVCLSRRMMVVVNTLRHDIPPYVIVFEIKNC